MNISEKKMKPLPSVWTKKLLANAYADLNTLLHNVLVGNTDAHNHKLRTSSVAKEPLSKPDGQTKRKKMYFFVVS